MLDSATQQDSVVPEDASPATEAAADPAAPVTGLAPASLAALPPAQRAAGVARLQATAGNAAVARVLGSPERSVGREPQRCACGGVLGADGQCDRCRAKGESGPAPASPSEAMARMIDADAREAASPDESPAPPRPSPVRRSAHNFPLADTIAAPDEAKAAAADAQAVATAPAPPQKAHGPPEPGVDLETSTSSHRAASTVARLVDPTADPGATAAGDTSEQLERVKETVAGTEAEAQRAGEYAGATAVAEIERTPEQLETGLAPVEQAGAEFAAVETRTAEEQAALTSRSAGQLTLESTQAAAAVAAVEPLAPALLSPARAIVEPGAVEADGGRIADAGRTVGGDATMTGDPGATATQAIGAGAQPLWNCDLAEIVASAGGIAQSAVAGAVSLGERAIGPARLAQAREFGAQMSGRVSDVAQQLGLDLSALSGSSSERFMAGAQTAVETAEAAAVGLRQRFTSLRDGAAQTIETVKTGLMERASSLAQGAGETIGSILGDARTRLAGAAETASSLLGGVGSALMPLLPAPLSGLVSAIPQTVAGLSERLQTIGSRIAGAAAAARDAVIAAAKSYLDARLQEWATALQLVEATIAGAKDLARRAGEAAVALVPERVRSMAAGVAAAAQGQMARLGQAAGAVADKIRDGACVALGAVAGPCVEQYLPELPGGATNSVRLTATGALIVPLEEIGVPANLKVAGGASVEVAVQSGVYTVKVDGEGALLLNELVGGDAHVGVGATGLLGDGAPEGQMAQAWNALAGVGAPDGAAAPDGGPAAPAAPGATATGALAPVATNAVAADAGGADVGRAKRAEVNAGVKGSAHAEWQFDATAAPTSCEGVGGLLTLLAGLGLAAALPPPFNQVASQGVARGFMDELQVCRFSVGLHLGAEADLKAGNLADIQVNGSAELMDNIELRRDPATNQLVAVQTRTATASLDATALGGLALGSFEKFRAYLAGEGIVRATLIYDDATGDILPSAVGAAASLTLGAKDVDFSLLAQLLPELGEALAELRALLDGTLPGMTGEREVKVSLTIGRTYEGFEALARELMQYFRGPVENITIDGVMDIVKRNLATIRPQDHIKLELSQTQRAALDLGAAEGAGIGAGAELDVTAEHTVSKAWWFGGEDDLVELAAKKGKQSRSTVQPGKGGGGGKPARMNFQVQWDSKNKGPCFSENEYGTDPPGITAAKAVAALTKAHGKVTPAAAKTASQAALANQIRWIQSRPANGGISQQGYSLSEYFTYHPYRDARVDVVNWAGHNLRQ